MAPKTVILAFDLYGTLLSTESIAKKLAEHFGDQKAPTLAATWRKYQLEYTWRLNSMQAYQPFSDVTRNALENTLAESGLSLSTTQIDDLMHAYDALGTFPDVSPALQKIRSKEGLVPVVFSNGTKEMVGASVNKSPDLGPHASTFKDLIVVEEVKRFKPDPDVYRMLAKKVGKPETTEGMQDMWLISGNPFDIVGARHMGMKACWVDRASNGWVDHLVGGERGRPTAIVSSLEQLVDVVDKHV